MNEKFGNGYALLIGVGQSAYPKWSLPVTVKDMQSLRAILTDPVLCSYLDDDAHIRLLHDAGATQQAILDGLAWLAAQAAADSDATAVVFYSGHGWLDNSTGRYYLLPHDVEPFDLAASALPATTFTNALRQVQARRLLVFVDSCHAAGMATAKDADALKLPASFSQAALPKGLVEELKQGAGRAVFTSSLGEQRSWVRLDGALSLYTFHLMEALQGAGNQPGDTTVRVSNLMAHLGKAVSASARAMGKEQTPFFDTATEDFAVALLLGGKGLGGGGLSSPQAGAASQPTFHGSDDSSVAAGTISDSTAITGNQNQVQQGKYNISIGNVQGLVIGDQAQVTQAFGDASPSSGQGSSADRQARRGDATTRHLRQQLTELQGKYETLSKRIAALDKDLGRALDSEHMLTLRDRRQELVIERNQVAQETAEIERRLLPNESNTQVQEQYGYLTLITNGAPVILYEVQSKEAYIGRDPSVCEIVIPLEFATVGRTHARLVHTEEGVFVEGLHENGTYVNHKLVPPHEKIPLKPNQLLMLGGTYPSKKACALEFSIERPHSLLVPRTERPELLKVLFLAIAPFDQALLRAEEEYRAISQALYQTEFEGRFDVRRCSAFRAIDLQDCLLRHKPAIVHLSARGAYSNEIMATDNFGRGKRFPPSALGRLFSKLEAITRCVILNACYTELQAQAMAEHIDYVIGISDLVEESTAVDFAVAFYRALGFGLDIPAALELSISGLELDECCDSGELITIIAKRGPDAGNIR